MGAPCLLFCPVRQSLSGPGKGVGAGRRFKVIFDDARVDLAVKARAGFGGGPVSLTGEGEFLLIGCGGARRAVYTPQRNRSGAVYPGSFMTAERSLTVWACPAWCRSRWK